MTTATETTRALLRNDNSLHVACEIDLAGMVSAEHPNKQRPSTLSTDETARFILCGYMKPDDSKFALVRHIARKATEAHERDGLMSREQLAHAIEQADEAERAAALELAAIAEERRRLDARERVVNQQAGQARSIVDDQQDRRERLRNLAPPFIQIEAAIEREEPRDELRSLTLRQQQCRDFLNCEPKEWLNVFAQTETFCCLAYWSELPKPGTITKFEWKGDAVPARPALGEGGRLKLHEENYRIVRVAIEAELAEVTARIEQIEARAQGTDLYDPVERWIDRGLADWEGITE